MVPKVMIYQVFLINLTIPSSTMIFEALINAIIREKITMDMGRAT
jgi:hypothetical protein